MTPSAGSEKSTLMPNPSRLKSSRTFNSRNCLPSADRQTDLQNVDFEGRTKMFVSLFQIRRQHIFDPFHECADSARQIAPMCYDEGHGERPATKIGYDLHKRSTL
jgi:hypothetical protein